MGDNNAATAQKKDCWRAKQETDQPAQDGHNPLPTLPIASLNIKISTSTGSGLQSFRSASAMAVQSKPIIYIMQLHLTERDEPLARITVRSGEGNASVCGQRRRRGVDMLEFGENRMTGKECPELGM